VHAASAAYLRANNLKRKNNNMKLVFQEIMKINSDSTYNRIISKS